MPKLEEFQMSSMYRIKSRRMGLMACIATLLATPLAQATPFGAQLLVNGDAESGTTAAWTGTGVDAVSTSISGIVGLPDGVSVGDFSFSGGTGNASSQSLTQTVSLGDIDDMIDALQVSFSFSALVQSRRNSDTTDTAKGSVRFLDRNGSTISGFEFLDPSVPMEVNDWSFVSVSQGVPAGTRSVQVFLDVSRLGGASSDGFFDNVHLSVSAVPEPQTFGLMALGLAAVGLGTRRKQAASRHAERAPQSI